MIIWKDTEILTSFWDIFTSMVNSCQLPQYDQFLLPRITPFPRMEQNCNDLQWLVGPEGVQNPQGGNWETNIGRKMICINPSFLFLINIFFYASTLYLVYEIWLSLKDPTYKCISILPDNVIFGLLLLAAATNISVSILVWLLLVLSHLCSLPYIYLSFDSCLSAKNLRLIWGGTERFGFARRKMWNWNPQVWQAHQ